MKSSTCGPLSGPNFLLYDIEPRLNLPDLIISSQSAIQSFSFSFFAVAASYRSTEAAVYTGQLMYIFAKRASAIHFVGLPYVFVFTSSVSWGIISLSSLSMNFATSARGERSIVSPSAIAWSSIGASPQQSINMKWKKARIARAGATVAPASLPPNSAIILFAFVIPDVS